MKFRFVCATRAAREDFFSKTALGRSLSVFWAQNRELFEVRVFDDNSTALPAVYNQAIEETAQTPRILFFVHDDVHLCDVFWPAHAVKALESFDIVGLAGNKRRVPYQPSWAYVMENGKPVWDARENLSGSVGHGKGFPPSQIDVFGPSCQEVKLLDGLMLIARSETLHASGIRFDERFDFHFYDMDLCRQAELKNLRMGTWTISVVHESDGNFGSESWLNCYRKYIDKWKS